MTRTAPSTAARLYAAPGFSPHLLFFCFYNLLYFVPVLLVFLLGYGNGGTVEALAIDGASMLRITFIYIAGLIGFALGCLPLRLLRSGRDGGARWSAAMPAIKLSDRLIVLLLTLVFVATKIALIPAGVYHEYAFSSGEMTGGLWSFSTFCSETMVFLGILVLFSQTRHNVAFFMLIAGLNGINLLHGSRIFFIVTVLSVLLYACFRGYVTLRRALLYGPLAGVSVLMLAYLVFLSRSGVSAEGAFSAAKIVSPIVYESVFSQISLVNLVRLPDIWDALGHPGYFFGDVMVNSAPRLILPDKDTLLYFSRFDYISPIGGMNGYAAGLIYFGFFFPFFYFMLGFIASWLYLKARTGPWWLLLYAYFTADFLFRTMRDGYLIPVKMLINTLQWVIIIVLARALFRLIKRNLGTSAGPPVDPAVAAGSSA